MGYAAESATLTWVEIRTSEKIVDELETFKTAINLTEYAAALGYCMDRKESSRSSVVMRHPNGDKVIVARGEDQHWVYFSVRDDADNGSIIDFVQRRQGWTLGAVRRELRPWIGGSGSAFVRPAAETFTHEISPVTRDRVGVLRALARMRLLVFHRYLEEERRIPRALLTGPRFAGKILVDARANAVFPHIDQAGPCGFEIKNRNYTAFAPGGEKGLWFSAVKTGDERLVFAESAIDALSYHILHPGALREYRRCSQPDPTGADPSGHRADGGGRRDHCRHRQRSRWP